MERIQSTSKKTFLYGHHIFLVFQILFLYKLDTAECNGSYLVSDYRENSLQWKGEEAVEEGDHGAHANQREDDALICRRQT